MTNLIPAVLILYMPLDSMRQLEAASSAKDPPVSPYTQTQAQ